MTTADKISEAFNNLAHLSGQVYDYWISELYLGDEMIVAMWNDETLNLMEQDVMMLSSHVGDDQ